MLFIRRFFKSGARRTKVESCPTLHYHSTLHLPGGAPGPPRRACSACFHSFDRIVAMLLKSDRVRAWLVLALSLLPLLAGCSTAQSSPMPNALPSPTAIALAATPLPSATPTVAPATPTAAPATATATVAPSPTPTATPTAVRGRYEVKPGDTLLAIALRHNMELEEFLAFNELTGAEVLRVGDSLSVPSSITVSLPQAYLLHDSEAVYGASYTTWDTQRFIEAQGGFLASYTEWGRSGAEIIEATAAKYHVGPRVLLALMETLSGWVSSPQPTSLFPFGLKDGGPPNLSWQAAWAAKELMEGYYGQLEGRRDWVILNNGVPARLFPGTNAGSAAVANVLAAVEPASTFNEFLLSERFQASYRRLFGQRGGGGGDAARGRAALFRATLSGRGTVVLFGGAAWGLRGWHLRLGGPGFRAARRLWLLDLRLSRARPGSRGCHQQRPRRDVD